MNSIAEEILSHFGERRRTENDTIDISVAEDILMHYGVKRRSGRYPWGSGDSPYQHSGDFLSRVEELKKQGLSEKDISKAMGLSTTELRVQTQLAKHERREVNRAKAQSLLEEGYNTTEIARMMGYANESSVRALLNDTTAENKNKAQVAANILKEQLETKGMIDVGYGVERELGISREKLEEALYILERDGYNVYGVGVPQPTNIGKNTTTKVLTRGDIAYRDVYENMGDIQPFKDYDLSIEKEKVFKYPASIDSKRIDICYGDEGGSLKDGVIEIRPGVKDLSLGNSHYAQVRILVDGTHYLKGMALYADDLPDGIDIRFNTNKPTGTDKMKVMKEIKHDDPDNPFGAAIKMNGGQSFYDDPNGKYTDPVTGKKQSLSAINKLKEEGDWDAMSRNLSQQMVSKQPYKFIKNQLDLTYKDYAAEFDDICSLNQQTVKRKLLLDFANDCEAAAIHLKAAALPRQSTQVILPLSKMKETEVYAPNYRNGEQVALIRYPHAGTFEIPILTVNNKNKSAIDILGKNIKDAIGINAKVAERLSGADFDGDQVVVIPLSSKVKIVSTPALKGLQNFDPKNQYSTEGKTGVRLMKKSEVNKQMGMISNLITDMTLRGADEKEMVKAVKHSMVIIDAYKHKLDFKQSEIDNDIQTLKNRYQKTTDANGNVVKVGGASTLLSRRKQTIDIPERQGSGWINRETGEMEYKSSGRTYVDKKGVTQTAKTKVPIMSMTKDARSLSSGTIQEEAYAEHANKLKALANTARKEYLATPRSTYSSTANTNYKNEVNSLNSKLNIAIANKPKERTALAIANSVIKAKLQDNPTMDKKEQKKIKQLALEEARNKVGSSGKDTRIQITPNEWTAIQAGALSDSKISEILKFADSKTVRELATPKTSTQLSDAKIAKIQTMKSMGYTNSEIADSMNISNSTVFKYLD